MTCDLKRGYRFRASQLHALAALFSPNLGQEVLVASLTEHQRVAFLARIVLLAMGK